MSEVPLYLDEAVVELPGPLSREEGIHLTQSVFHVVCSWQLPYKSVNVSFTTTNIKSKLTNLCGN